MFFLYPIWEIMGLKSKKNTYIFARVEKSLYLCTRKTKKHRGVEQLVARQAHNLEVARSNPASATQQEAQPRGAALLSISELF